MDFVRGKKKLGSSGGVWRGKDFHSTAKGRDYLMPVQPYVSTVLEITGVLDKEENPFQGEEPKDGKGSSKKPANDGAVPAARRLNKKEERRGAYRVAGLRRNCTFQLC